MSPTDRPATVPEAAWEACPETRRPFVLRLAGRMVLRGMSPEDAWDAGIAKDRHDALLQRDPGRVVLHTLSEAFADFVGDSQPREAHITAAMEACLDVGELHADAVIDGADPVRVALQEGLWRVPEGCCAACGEDLDGPPADFPLPLHEGCRDVMRVVGAAFRAAATSMASEH